MQDILYVIDGRRGRCSRTSKWVDEIPAIERLARLVPLQTRERKNPDDVFVDTG